MLRFWKAKARFSVPAMLLANFLPLIGVFLWEWDARALVFLYWSESVVIGLFNIAKMAAAQGDGETGPREKLRLVPLFCLHYGALCVVCLALILALITPMRNGQFSLVPDTSLIGVLMAKIWLPLLAIFLSHGVSFVEGTLSGGEYKTATVARQMRAPYTGAFLMYLGLIGTGLLASKFADTSRLLLTALVLGKILIDVFHLGRLRRSRFQSAVDGLTEHLFDDEEGPPGRPR